MQRKFAVASTPKCAMQMITSLTVAHSDVYILEQQMNHDLHEIHTWLIANNFA